MLPARRLGNLANHTVDDAQDGSHSGRSRACALPFLLSGTCAIRHYKGESKVEMLSGGDMLIRALRDEGVDYIFGYPGGAALHIYDAIFRQQDVTHILVRPDQESAPPAPYQPP